MRQLGDREDVDEVEEQLEEGRPLLALLPRADGRQVRDDRALRSSRGAADEQAGEDHEPDLDRTQRQHSCEADVGGVEAVRNNAIGTRVCAQAAADVDTKRFVLVSTDKAVNPENALGASKAMAEWLVEALGRRHPGTVFCTVRFGNVLGSSGSVVQLFRRQIEQGGPVTVTDPEMRRYFMTIPESVQLIIRAGRLASGGETYVLEMGEQVKIIDLARNMIRLSGQNPDDVPIEFIGRRSGEKLREELFHAAERPVPTEADRILRADRPALDPESVDSVFERVEQLVARRDEAFFAQTLGDIARDAFGASSREAEEDAGTPMKAASPIVTK